jgi:hypothetical protein
VSATCPRCGHRPSGVRCGRCHHDQGVVLRNSEVVAVAKALLSVANQVEEGRQVAIMDAIRLRLHGEL